MAEKNNFMFNKEEKKVAEELSNSSNTIGKGTTVEGNIETFGNLRVDGRVVGNIVTKSKLVLGQTSQVDGNIFYFFIQFSKYQFSYLICIKISCKHERS